MLACLDYVDRSTVVAAADTDQGSRERVRPLLPPGCPVYDHPHRVLEQSDVETIYIGTPDDQHTQLVLESLEAGKAVLCEKPMATTLEDCDRILTAVQATDLFFAVTMQLRYTAWAGKMGQLLASGELGTPAMMWCHEFRGPFLRDKVGDWIVYHQRSGGPFVEKNSHHWDIFNLWAGTAPTAVSAMTQNTGIHRPGDVWDAGWATVRYQNGIMANLGLSMISPHGHELTFGVIGTDGWAEGQLSRTGGTVRHWRNTGQPEETWAAALPQKALALGHRGAEMPMLEELFDCIETGRPAPTTALWARESVLVGLAAERSAREGRVVQVDELRQASTFPKATPFQQHSGTAGDPSP
jgi:predicted dehydrogenase